MILFLNTVNQSYLKKKRICDFHLSYFRTTETQLHSYFILFFPLFLAPSKSPGSYPYFIIICRALILTFNEPNLTNRKYYIKIFWLWYTSNLYMMPKSKVKDLIMIVSLILNTYSNNVQWQ